MFDHQDYKDAQAMEHDAHQAMIMESDARRFKAYTKGFFWIAAGASLVIVACTYASSI